MSLRALIFIGFFIFLHGGARSQDYFSYGGGNFSGLNQVIANPAAAADNRLKLDVILVGIDFNFNNSWFNVKREALKNSGTLTKPVFPASWSNETPNVADNIFKNFTIIDDPKKRSILLENRMLLPSVMFQIDSKNSVAFTWSVRQIANIEGITPEFANLFEKEMDLSVTQNNRIHLQNFRAFQMSWVEYGFTYARVLKDKNKHFLKAGATPKLLRGLESAYLLVRDLDFLFSTKDTNSYFNADFSYAHSEGFNPSEKSDHPVSDFYRNGTKLRMGLDLGVIYEWRPHFKNYKYKEDGKHFTWRKDLNKYKLKFGASLVDIGRIKFKKGETNYDLSVRINRQNFEKFYAVSDYEMFDSIVKADYSSENQTSQFSVFLPTALNTQVDYSINEFFYLNLSSHFTDFHRSSSYKVQNYSAVCFAPRVEHYWFDISIPFTYNMLSVQRNKKIMTGLNLRLGPLCLGTNNLGPIFKGDISAFNFYVILKVSIPYKSIKDRDGDRINDKKDACPDDPGEIAVHGCPDHDHDDIPDKEDACPHQAGLTEFKGCPDTDTDGIKDGEDACPHEKGGIELKGCPDLDKDSIPDKDDACADTPGLQKYKGCPDTDGDGIIDKEDECPSLKGILKYKGCMNRDDDFFHDGIDQCPDVAGPIENLGCPWLDADKDGVIDKLDSCVNIPGLPELKGCPAPPKLAPAEKRILEKAFSSLQFESGKDIIKPVSFPSLTALAKLLVKHKTDWQIKLSGHTDNEGTEESNLILSEKRSKALQAYLVKKGAPLESILVEWFGQSKPVADNATKEGRKINRRVEMTVMMKVE